MIILIGYKISRRRTTHILSRWDIAIQKHDVRRGVERYRWLIYSWYADGAFWKRWTFCTVAHRMCWNRATRWVFAIIWRLGKWEKFWLSFRNELNYILTRVWNYCFHGNSGYREELGNCLGSCNLPHGTGWWVPKTSDVLEQSKNNWLH